MERGKGGREKRERRRREGGREEGRGGREGGRREEGGERDGGREGEQPLLGSLISLGKEDDNPYNFSSSTSLSDPGHLMEDDKKSFKNRKKCKHNDMYITTCNIYNYINF